MNLHEIHRKALEKGPPLPDRHDAYYDYLAALSADGVRAWDIGTNEGRSALALNLGGCLVTSFDIYDLKARLAEIHGGAWLATLGGIHVVQHNLACQIAPFGDELLRVGLIFLDVDPHDGIQEVQIVNNLMASPHGEILLVCDDIRISAGMAKFWDWLPYDKLDVTDDVHRPFGFGIAALPTATSNPGEHT